MSPEHARESGGNRVGVVVRTLALGMLLSLGACSSVGQYLGDRGLDFVDIVDLKYGVGLGAVAKVEASDYLGTGLGIGLSRRWEWFGRRVDDYDAMYGHVVVAGGEVSGHYNFEGNLMFWGVYEPADWRPPPEQRFRVGGEALLGIPHLGVYLNLFEVVDFFGGLVGLDPAEDDAVPFGSSFEDYRDDYYSQEWRRVSGRQEGDRQEEPRDQQEELRLLQEEIRRTQEERRRLRQESESGE